VESDGDVDHDRPDDDVERDRPQRIVLTRGVLGEQGDEVALGQVGLRQLHFESVRQVGAVQDAG